MQDANDIKNQMDLTDIYGTFIPKIFKFLILHATMSKSDYILKNKASLNR